MDISLSQNFPLYLGQINCVCFLSPNLIVEKKNNNISFYKWTEVLSWKHETFSKINQPLFSPGYPVLFKSDCLFLSAAT